MLKHTILVAAVAGLVLASVAQGGILNYTTFDAANAGSEPVTNDGTCHNGWQYYNEQSGTNKMTFAPGSNLATDAPTGVGEDDIDYTTRTYVTITQEVVDFEAGGAGNIVGIAQTFTSLGAYEVTIEVNWGRHERWGNGMDVVDGTGAFSAYDVEYHSASYWVTYEYMFTPTQPQFRIFFASNAIAGTGGGGNHDANGNIDWIRVSQVPEPATMALLALGGLGLVLGRKRR